MLSDVCTDLGEREAFEVFSTCTPPTPIGEG